MLCFLVGLLPGFLVLSPDLLRSCFGSSTAMGEWVAGSRSLTADVHVSRISCGLPMRGVGFLVRMEVEDGGSMFWRTIKKFGEPYWRPGSYVFSFALAEGGLDSPLMGLFSELVTSSATADSVRSIHLVGAAGSFLFQDLDGNGRRTPEGRWFAATSWRSLSTSWLSSSPGRRAPFPTSPDPEGVPCVGVLRQDPRVLGSNLIFLRVLYGSFRSWRMNAVDCFVIPTYSLYALT